MKLSEILNKIKSLPFIYNNYGELITADNIKLSVNANVDGLFAGQITLCLILENRVFFRYGCCDSVENQMVADWFKIIKNESVNLSEDMREKKSNEIKNKLGI